MKELLQEIQQALADLLAGEGLSLARRTVAKYRQALGLPPAWRRKGGRGTPR